MALGKKCALAKPLWLYADEKAISVRVWQDVFGTKAMRRKNVWV
jgi:hypothetical protein